MLLFWWQLNLKILTVNILLDGKSYENILAYDISYKILFESKPLSVRFG